MLVRRRVLLDTERDADLIAAIDGARNKAGAMRAWLRAGMQAGSSPAALDLGAVEAIVRAAIRSELAGLQVQRLGAGNDGPGPGEVAKAKVKSMFGKVMNAQDRISGDTVLGGDAEDHRAG